MKAVIVIVIDDDIVESNEGLDNISVSYEVQTIIDSKTVVLQGDVDVPLKPLPQRMSWGHSSDYIEGYNACLKDITGETE